MTDRKEDSSVSLSALIIVCIIAMAVCLAFEWVSAFWIAFVALLVIGAVAIFRSPGCGGARLPWQ